MKLLKKGCCALLALAVMLTAATALAAGNVNIAIRGRNGFDTYIENMLVSGDQLLLFSYDEMYMWSEETGLVKVEGYNKDALYDLTRDEDGAGRVTLGGTEIELDEDEDFAIRYKVYAVDGKTYMAADLYGRDGVETTFLVELIIGNDGSMSAGEVIDIGDVLVMDWGDGYYEPVDLPTTFDMNGVLYGPIDLDDGPGLLAIDTKSGESDSFPLDINGGIEDVARFDDHRALMVLYDYDAGDSRLYLFDIDTEAMTELGSLPRIGYGSPVALCYDSERGQMYYCLGGSVWRMPVTEDGLGAAEEFGDMPLDVYNGVTCALLGDTYVVAASEGVIGRDVTVERMPPEHLVINTAHYDQCIRNAYYDFTEEHPEYTVSIRSSDTDIDALVQAMLSRSADVDIYMMSSSDAAFLTLLSRGYMAELGGNEKLTALVGSMYPVLQEFVTQDGELYAVPIAININGSVGYNKNVFVEKLGYSEDDMPASWEELFALIAELSANNRMQDVPEASLLGPYTTERSAKSGLFDQMMEAYFLWLDADPENLTHGNETLLRLCDAFEQVDWSGLGFIAEEDQPDDYMYSLNNVMLSSYATFTPGSYIDESKIVPLMSLLENEEPMFGAQVDLVFVNPFSAHREAAIEYIEKTAALIGQTDLLLMCPDRNDPIESKYYEENLKAYDESIARLEESIAKAEENEDDETIAALTEELESKKEEADEYRETGRWDVSPEEIQAYREIAQYMRVKRSSLFAMAGSETYSKINQYLDGAIDKQQFVRELERTIQMQRQETM